MNINNLSYSKMFGMSLCVIYRIIANRHLSLAINTFLISMTVGFFRKSLKIVVVVLRYQLRPQDVTPDRPVKTVFHLGACFKHCFNWSVIQHNIFRLKTVSSIL